MEYRDLGLFLRYQTSHFNDTLPVNAVGAWLTTIQVKACVDNFKIATLLQTTGPTIEEVILAFGHCKDKGMVGNKKV